MAGAAAALRAAARECQLAAPSFSDEQAAQGLAISAMLRARFLPPAFSAQADSLLLQLPAELGRHPVPLRHWRSRPSRRNLPIALSRRAHSSAAAARNRASRDGAASGTRPRRRLLPA